MIHKIIQIKNVGKFKEYHSSNSNWNGILNKNTAIYADNGSGKTTLAQIFKSLKGDNQVLLKRQSFGSQDPISVHLMDGERKLVKFDKNKWNHLNDKIEIFDTYFIESNVYLITLGNYDKKGTFFEIIVGDEAISLAEMIVELRTKRKLLSQGRRNIKQKIRKENPNETILKELEKKILMRSFEIEQINSEIPKIEANLIKLAEEFGQTYLSKINEYLRYFNPNIELTKLNKKGSFFVYYLKIMNFDVRSDSESISLKHTLSEGDKSSLALSFFLARLALKSDLQDRIVVFDDPISSFDHNRRNVTINLLNSLSKRVKQFVLLSHDINFVKDFSTKVDGCLNLKIKFSGTSSILETHNIYYETLTGIFKDLTVVDGFIKNGECSEFDKREVVRCLRPILEGMFRIKFFNSVKEDQWLGDFISEIRNSNSGDKFYHFKPILEELVDINDYSKIYHHSNPNYLENPINTEELRNYCLRTINLLIKI